MEKYELGNSSESIVLSAYVRAGFKVSIPFGSGASYDLIVDAKHALYRIQVKTGCIKNGVLRHKCLRRQSGRETRRLYKENEVDFFAVYCPVNYSLYGIPVKNHTSHGWLRIEPVKNNQSKLIRWASDFSWENHLTELRKNTPVKN